ncbi:helix-turn-helix domain-containing protein [Actinomadura rifamycini]|uniref:helix-turn-helix domain-containing protein n=1 Tax=Actinomadura rifamycini TaxID=31962 RepID=UPI0004205FC6|nr:helix-turn-helix domain-containing protein [Actinomadura rifamycini]
MTEGYAGVVRRLEPRVPTLARAVVADYAARSPLYGDRIPLQLQTVMASTCRLTLRLMLGSLLDRDVREEDLRLVRERARERAAEGVPFQEYIRALHGCLNALWDELGAALADAPAALAPAMRRAHDVNDALQEAGAAGYDEHARTAAAEYARDGARVVSALLAGDPSPLVAHFQGEVPAVLTLVVVELPPEPPPAAADEVDPAARRVTAHRRARRILDALERLYGAEPPADLRASGGVLLLTGALDAEVDAGVLAERVGRAAGGPVTLAAEPVRAPGEAPAAAAAARRILRIVRGTGRPPGAYRLADVALEYHLGADSRAAPVLLAAMAPLAGRAELWETLLAYFARDLDRRGAARALGVHPNTVDNRLARVHALTGVDVTTADGLLTAAVAVAHHRRAAAP